MSKIKVPDSYVLSNNLGSFWFYSQSPYTKFGGLHFFENEYMIKCIENLKIDGNISKTLCARHSLLNKREELSEKISFGENFNGIKQELSEKRDVSIQLDVRCENDFSEWGRNYTIKEKEIIPGKTLVIIKFQKEKNKPLYTAILSKKCDYEILEKFTKVEYEYDQFRNTASERYIFEAIKINTNQLSIGFSSSEIIAVDNAKKAFELKYDETFVEYEDDLEKAKYEVDLNMQKLISKRGIIAGLPWFYQTWARDEMISSIYLINKGRYSELKKMFEKYFKFEYIKGFPAILPGEGIPSADGAGWMYKRFDDFLETLMRENKLEEVYSTDEIIKISIFLQDKYRYIEEELTKDGIVHSGFNETWMDTSYTDDGRAGFCIEIQALTAKILSTIYILTDDENYKQKELELRKKTKEKFFENGNICDHITEDNIKDLEIRPNFFIACYVYQDLFSKEEWENIIDNSLPKIWLEWGGLSSIEKKSKLFTENYTGENNASYHRGDSWYFINCMAAICMIRINKEKYSSKINEIVNACLTEIYSNGVIGALAEVSSAKELSGYGCLSQAWSNALFLELLDLI